MWCLGNWHQVSKDDGKRRNSCRFLYPKKRRESYLKFLWNLAYNEEKRGILYEKYSQNYGRLNALDYAKKEGLEAGYAEGLQIGMEKGMAEGIILTARNLKQAGISKEIIAQTTGLSTEEIDQL